MLSVLAPGYALAQPSCPAPFAGSMLEFDGVDDWCRVPVNADFIFAGGFTLEAWVRPQVVGGGGVAGRWGAGGLEDSYLLFLRADGGPSAVIDTEGVGGFIFADGAGALPAATWTHLAMTYDGTFLRLYRNGAQTAVEPTVGDLVPAEEADFRIGIEDIIFAEPHYFRGALDEVRLWNVARSGADILNTRDLTIADPYCEPHLVGLWRFDETAGLQTIVDATRFQHHGTRGADSSAGADDPGRTPSTAPLVNFPDCNGNSDADACDIDNGSSDDVNGSGIPDECECPWDLDASGAVATQDFLDLLTAWGPAPPGPPDFDCDGNVGTSDFLALLVKWGPCPGPLP